MSQHIQWKQYIPSSWVFMYSLRDSHINTGFGCKQWANDVFPAWPFNRSRLIDQLLVNRQWYTCTEIHPIPAEVAIFWYMCTWLKCTKPLRACLMTNIQIFAFNILTKYLKNKRNPHICGPNALGFFPWCHIHVYLHLCWECATGQAPSTEIGVSPRAPRINNQDPEFPIPGHLMTGYHSDQALWSPPLCFSQGLS